jgi:glutathione S-transferase
MRWFRRCPVIGNKNYSSWSMRPWLVLRQAGIPFEEVYIPLYRPDSAAALAQWSPSGKVPALRDGDIPAWDSLAICEYLNECFPEKQLWPLDAAARAAARSVRAETASPPPSRCSHASSDNRALPPRAN